MIENVCSETLKFPFRPSEWKCTLQQGHEGEHRDGITTWIVDNNSTLVFQNGNFVFGKSRQTYKGLDGYRLEVV